MTGTVTDPAGQPIAGAVVEAHNPNNLPSTLTEITDKKGKFTFGRLIDGSWGILVQADGFLPHQEVVEAIADERMAPLKIRLERVAPQPPALEAVQAQAARDAFQRGVDNFRAGDYAQALAAFREFKELEPANTEVELNLALTLQALKDYRAAVAAYRTYLEQQPEHVEARIRLGECLVQTGEMDAALAQFESALELRPEDASLQYNIGEVLFSAERREEAIEHYGRAVELAPDLADGHLKLAFCLVALDRKAEALPYLKRYLELQPQASNAETIRGLVNEIESGGG